MLLTWDEFSITWCVKIKRLVQTYKEFTKVFIYFTLGEVTQDPLQVPFCQLSVNCVLSIQIFTLCISGH